MFLIEVNEISLPGDAMRPGRGRSETPSELTKQQSGSSTTILSLACNCFPSASLKIKDNTPVDISFSCFGKHNQLYNIIVIKEDRKLIHTFPCSPDLCSPLLELMN